MQLLDHGGKLRLEILGSNIEEDFVITDGKWHHLAAIWENSNGNIAIFADGQILKDDTGKGKDKEVSKAGILYIGHEQTTSYGYEVHADKMYLGVMTEFNIWNTSFTKQQIMNLNATCQSDGQGNVLSWRKDILQGINGNVYKQSPSTCV